MTTIDVDALQTLEGEEGAELRPCGITCTWTCSWTSIAE
ncbi:ALQxL family class IV lanthipeptide [Streptomyces sp. JJ36]|nr:ALQxL family class IV lanthipeptide [Streptomyces sp. JJ36]MCF6524641.1 ALQxL family class IV lanthipeptide [Streptomyces sp. JJ36]